MIPNMEGNDNMKLAMERLEARGHPLQEDDRVPTQGRPVQLLPGQGHDLHGR
jgi:hypothetical protein